MGISFCCICSAYPPKIAGRSALCPNRRSTPTILLNTPVRFPQDSCLLRSLCHYHESFALRAIGEAMVKGMIGIDDLEASSSKLCSYLGKGVVDTRQLVGLLVAISMHLNDPVDALPGCSLDEDLV